MRPPSCLCRVQNCSSGAATRYVSSGSKRRFLSANAGPNDDASVRLREVMRNVPQPVAIVTARNTSPSSSAPFHGATLTSFTSLTLHPHPLVAFSLRLPSRLADCLRTSLDPSSAPLPPAAPCRIPLTVSLLSRSNQPIADALSSRLPDQSTIFARPEWSTSVDNHPPALKQAIGALRCEVVSSIPLRDMCHLGDSDPVQEGEFVTSHQLAGSELFICRVLDVLPGAVDAEPLLHLKQSYVGVGNQAE